MPIENLEASKSQITYRVEVPEVVTVGTVSNRIITLSGTVTSHRYAMQQARVVYSGSNKGYFYDIVDNTTNSLIMAENVEGEILANARLAITTYSQPLYPNVGGGVDKYFGDLPSSDLPWPSWSLFKGRYHGNSNMPQPSEVVPMVKNYQTGGVSHIVKNFEFMALAFGRVEEYSSTDDYEAHTNSVGTSQFPGDDTLREVNGTFGNFTTGDIIMVGIAGTATQSMRETAVIARMNHTDSNLILESPLKNYHDNNATIYIVDTNGTTGAPRSPIVHVLRVADEVPCFTIEQAYLRDRIGNSTSNHIVTQFLGLIVTSLDISSSAGDTNPLQASYDMVGLQMRNGTDPTDSASSYITTPSTVVKEGFDRGNYKWHWSQVKVNGVEYGEAGDMGFRLSREVETKYGHHNKNRPFFTGGDPVRHICGAVDPTFSLTLPMKNMNLLELLKEGSGFNATFTFYRNATNEYVKFHATDCYLTNPITSLPPPGAIDQDLQAEATTAYVEVADYVPYYAL